MSADDNEAPRGLWRSEGMVSAVASRQALRQGACRVAREEKGNNVKVFKVLQVHAYS